MATVTIRVVEHLAQRVDEAHERGGLARMHIKSIWIDRPTLPTGSVNLTQNGMERDKEHLCVLTSAHLDAVEANFEMEWMSASEVTQQTIGKMMMAYEGAQARKSRSRSASASRSVSRSLTSELASVNEPHE